MLEELCLQAAVGDSSSVVTNVRSLAERLELNKDTVTRAVNRLIAAEVLVRRPQSTDASHRFGPVTYSLRLPAGLRLVAGTTSPKPTRTVHRDGQLQLLDIATNATTTVTH